MTSRRFVWGLSGQPPQLAFQIAWVVVDHWYAMLAEKLHERGARHPRKLCALPDADPMQPDLLDDPEIGGDSPKQSPLTWTYENSGRKLFSVFQKKGDDWRLASWHWE